MMAHHYTYPVTWSAEDEEFVGLCTEFPSLSWLAQPHEAAFAGIRQLVDDCVADLEANEPGSRPTFSARSPGRESD